MKRVILLLTLLAAVTACTSNQSGNPTAASTPTLPKSVNEWNIVMTHSGGIMGLLRHIEINSSGEFTVRDERTKQTKTGILSQNDLETLGDLVETVKPVSIDPLKNMVCADCFVYSLEIRRDGKSHSAELDDINLPNSGYELLVTELRKIMDDVLR